VGLDATSMYKANRWQARKHSNMSGVLEGGCASGAQRPIACSTAKAVAGVATRGQVALAARQARGIVGCLEVGRFFAAGLLAVVARVAGSQDCSLWRVARGSAGALAAPVERPVVPPGGRASRTCMRQRQVFPS
jgi:hypothetical protein